MTNSNFIKNQIIFAILLLLIISFSSCKKETSCESCNDQNKPPISIAGPDHTITLPTDSILLDGNASSDPDGTISDWLWTKIEGPASFAINNSTSSKTVVKNLSAGIYQFELKVQDNGGLSGKDTVKIVVNDPSQANRPPIANAGTDLAITLPNNTATLDGSGSTDHDNNITSYAWIKISGPSSFNIVNASTVQSQVTNLVQGTYQFELKVTDAGGLFAKDTTLITVNNVSANCAQLVPVGTLSIPREFVCAATAGTKVLFAGGATQTSPSYIASSRVDIYDMVTQNWSTAELSIPRVALVATTLSNKIFFTDGFYNASSRVDIYDASTNSWSTAELSTVRAGLASGSAGNKVVFAGGYVPYWDRIDIHDVSTNAWTTGILDEPRTEISVSSLESKIYFSGGLNYPSISKRVDIYNASTNSWSTVAMTSPRWSHLSISAGNKLFWAGGASSFNSDGDAISNNSVEIYDVSTGNRTFHQLSQNPFYGTIMHNKVVFIPVISLFSVSSSFLVDVYDINTESWTICSISLPTPTGIGWKKAIVAAANKIYMTEGGLGPNLPKVWKLEF